MPYLFDTYMLQTYYCPERGCKGTFDPDRLKPVKKPKDVALSIKKGRDIYNYLPTLEQSSEWLEDFDKGKASLPHSSKLEAIRKQIQGWRRRAPKEKIVIFVQWKLMMILVGIMLEEENELFLYYSVRLSLYLLCFSLLTFLQGDMKEQDRSDALNEFKTSPSVNILIIGLKVGGVGLNLMFANRAIIVYVSILSLFYNFADSSTVIFGGIVQ